MDKFYLLSERDGQASLLMVYTHVCVCALEGTNKNTMMN